MKSAIFFHRSVGCNLIDDGNIYQLFRDAGGIIFNDYDQNTDRLTGFGGTQEKLGLVFPNNNTKPQDYYLIFSEDVTEKYKPIQDLALGYDIIIIKSCYPNSNIKTDADLEVAKFYYQSICKFFMKHQDKTLIILTSPPLVPLTTSRANARRARQLANWLKNITFGENIKVFDLFDQLATSETDKLSNVLKRRYRRSVPFDSHPNALASREIVPGLVSFIEELS